MKTTIGKWARAAWALAMGMALGVATAATSAPPPGPASAPAPRVRLAIIRTAQRPVREAMLFAGGRFGTMATIHFSAFLVEHGDDRLLFDTGLGRGIDAQYDADMPHWMRPFFRYDAPVVPAREQLDRAHVPPVRRVLLSHAHWDHASGLADFPEAEVELAPEELAFVREAGTRRGAPWPSQVGAASIRWKPLALARTTGPDEGFERSVDLYGDGSVVAVGLPGHTPGSIGLLVRVSSGRRFLLVGDVVWNAGALAQARPKFAPARWIVDDDVARTQDAIGRIQAAQRRDPSLVVIPAHDGDLQARLGLFPAWLE
jgi:glyoxylase-like metal-dependent hydrolase (beta-lactamase superfamily II)